MTRVAIKYCGNCNPWVDLAQQGYEVERQLQALGVAVCRPDSEDLDLIVILNGCPRACADRPDVRQRAKNQVVLTGSTIEVAQKSDAVENIVDALTGL